MVKYGVFYQQRGSWSGPYYGTLHKEPGSCRRLAKVARRRVKKPVRVLKVVVDS